MVTSKFLCGTLNWRSGYGQQKELPTARNCFVWLQTIYVIMDSLALLVGQKRSWIPRSFLWALKLWRWLWNLGFCGISKCSIGSSSQRPCMSSNFGVRPAVSSKCLCGTLHFWYGQRTTRWNFFLGLYVHQIKYRYHAAFLCDFTL